MSNDQQIARTTQLVNSKLTEEEIEKIYTVFVETGGHISRTAQRMGYAKSTISKYARKGRWLQESRRDNSAEPLSQDNDDGEAIWEESIDSEGQTLPKLKELRELLFAEIMEKQKPHSSEESSLKIPPKTLAEVVKALIDIDKRITEREGPQSGTALDAYRNILMNCARIIKDEPNEKAAI